MQVPAQTDIRELHEFEPIVIVDLTDAESLKSGLEYYRKKNQENEDLIDENTLNHLAIDQNLDLYDVLRAYLPVLIEEGKTLEQIKNIYLIVLGISELRLHTFLTHYRKLLAANPSITKAAALSNLSFAMPDGFWGKEDMLEKLFNIVEICGLLSIES